MNPEIMNPETKAALHACAEILAEIHALEPGEALRPGMRPRVRDACSMAGRLLWLQAEAEDEAISRVALKLPEVRP